MHYINCYPSLYMRYMTFQLVNVTVCPQLNAIVSLIELRRFLRSQSPLVNALVLTLPRLANRK